MFVFNFSRNHDSKSKHVINIGCGSLLLNLGCFLCVYKIGLTEQEGRI